MPEDNSLIPRPEDELPAVQLLPEESQDWVIEVYRKHCLRQVTSQLEELLGTGRGKKRRLPRVLLDDNAVDFRQSLHEQVYPTPRAINEAVWKLGNGKVLLQAPSGMGKTVYLLTQLEALLENQPHPLYPVPVYLHLGTIKEGDGFQHLFELIHDVILQTVLKEQEDDPDRRWTKNCCCRRYNRWRGKVFCSSRWTALNCSIPTTVFASILRPSWRISLIAVILF